MYIISVAYLSALFKSFSDLSEKNLKSKEECVMKEEYTYIFVAYITLKNGKRLYARNYGKRAFRIRVKK